MSTGGRKTAIQSFEWLALGGKFFSLWCFSKVLGGFAFSKARCFSNLLGGWVFFRLYQFNELSLGKGTSPRDAVGLEFQRRVVLFTTGFLQRRTKTSNVATKMLITMLIHIIPID